MPITATQCVPQRWRAGCRNWAFSDPFPGHGCRTTTPIPSHCSVRRNISWTTQAVRSPARKRRASGWRHLRTVTTIGTATAGSSSWRPTSATTVMLWRSAVTGLSSTRRRASETHAGGHDPLVAGVNQRWSGLTHHQQNLIQIQLRLKWLLERQQGHHLPKKHPRPSGISAYQPVATSW